MSVTLRKPVITWEKLPDNYVLDDEPVDNMSQPPIAAALSEALELAGRLQAPAIASTNVAVCATIDGKLAKKAPDWFYVPSVLPTNPPDRERRSYTPHEEGEVPAIVMEFLSATEGEEYSMSKQPIGKWYYYEQILQVPIYAIFEPQAGWLEVYQLESQKYREREPDRDNRYWIPGMGLFLGVWQGTKQNRTGNWLRWWDENGQMLPWGVERLQQDEQLLEQERRRTEQERRRTEQEREAKEAALRELALLKEKLNSAGINPMEI